MEWKDVLKYLIDKFKIDIKLETKRMHKSAILMTFMLITVYILASSFSLLFNLAIFSKMMLIAAFAYELIFLELCRKYLQDVIERFRFKKFINAAKDFVLTLFLFITFVIVFVIVVLPVTGAGSALLSLLVGILLFLLPYAFFEEMLEGFYERVGEKLFKIKFKGVLVFLMLLVSLNLVTAQNDTGILGALDSIHSLANGLSTIGHYIGKFLEFTGTIKDFFAGAGLSNLQSNVVIIVAALIGFYFFLRLLKWLVKWTIIFMVLWVTLQVIGII